jgi:ABC-2 type transport system ATP-binding protein
MTRPLELRSLSKNYGSLQAVKNVSFHLEPGEIFGLLGPNGAGKTSIISIVNTLEEPTSGEAFVFGNDVTDRKGLSKPFLGVVPQEMVTHGFFNVEEVLRFHSGYYGIRHNEDQIRFLLEQLDLWPHRLKRVRQLSGGMKRRLLIAKALVHRPKLLLLDEPTAGVDIELRTSLWKFVKKLNQEGTSILLTTHYLEEAEQLCHKVGILHRGELLKIDETKRLVHQLTTREITLCLKRPIAKVDLKYTVSQSAQEILFRVPNDFDLGQILATIPSDTIHDIRIREGKLEDAFLHLLEEK